MAESFPSVTFPGDENLTTINPSVDTVVLREVIVEELTVVEGLDLSSHAYAFVVSEPSDTSLLSDERSEHSVGVIVQGSSEGEEGEVEAVERVAKGPPRGGMSTDAGTHPVTVPSEMPVDDVPPDETMTALVGEGGEVEASEEGVDTEGEKGEKKRAREEGEGEGEEEEEVAGKKLKSDEEEKVVEPKKLGPKVFNTGVEMFSYFYNLLHDWNLNQNVNKYEFLVLTELVSQGNPDKVKDGIAAFQVRQHPKWQSRCYFILRKDGSEDDFSYRKCCDALMPLPKSLYRKNGEIDLEKLFPGQKGRHQREQQQNGGGGGRGGRFGGRGDHKGGRGGGGRFGGGRGGGGRGGRGGGRRGGRGRW